MVSFRSLVLQLQAAACAGCLCVGVPCLLQQRRRWAVARTPGPGAAPAAALGACALPA